jgi:hypothetical protein
VTITTAFTGAAIHSSSSDEPGIVAEAALSATVLLCERSGSDN